MILQVPPISMILRSDDFPDSDNDTFAPQKTEMCLWKPWGYWDVHDTWQLDEKKLHKQVDFVP